MLEHSNPRIVRAPQQRCSNRLRARVACVLVPIRAGQPFTHCQHGHRPDGRRVVCLNVGTTEDYVMVNKRDFKLIDDEMSNTTALGTTLTTPAMPESEQPKPEPELKAKSKSKPPPMMPRTSKRCGRTRSLVTRSPMRTCSRSSSISRRPISGFIRTPRIAAVPKLTFTRSRVRSERRSTFSVRR